MSLERLDKVLDDTRRKEAELQDKIKARAAADGIDLGVINECERIVADQRTPLEQHIVDTQRLARRVTENNDIDEQLRAQLQKTQTYLTEWQKIRDMFVELYPSAPTSPRLPRPELDQIAARSPPALEKSRSLTTLISPRRLLRNSGKMSVVPAPPPSPVSGGGQ